MSHGRRRVLLLSKVLSARRVVRVIAVLATGAFSVVALAFVPAQVAGNYKTAAGDFNLKQDFQMLIGTMRAGGRTVPVEGKVRGEEITLTSGAKTWRGRKNSPHFPRRKTSPCSAPGTGALPVSTA